MSIRELTRNSLTFAIGGIAYKAVAVLAVPLLARLLTPAQLGLLDFSALAALAVSMLVVAGTENAVARYERHRDAGTLWASLLALVATTGAIALVFAAVAEALRGMLFLQTPEQLPLAVVYGVALALLAVGLNVVRLRATSRTYAFLSLAVVLVEMLVAIGLAAALRAPVEWILIGWTVVSGAAAAFVLVRFLPPLRLPDRRLVIDLARFGLPLVPAAFAWVLGDVAIRWWLVHHSSLADLGAYGIAHRVANVLTLAAAAFGLAWHPMVYRTSSERLPALVRRVAALTTAALAGLALLLAAMGRELVLLIAGEEYLSGVPAIPPLALGFAAFGLFTVLTAVAGVELRTGWVARASVAGLVVQVVSAPLLINAAGITGAAVSAMLGFFTALALMLPVGLRAGLGKAPTAFVLLFIGGVTAGVALLLHALTSAPLPPRVLAVAAAWVMISSAVYRVRRSQPDAAQ